MDERRVVITGLGVVSSIGIGEEAFWKALLNGTSGITPVSSFDTSAFSRHLAGEVKDFRAQDFIPAPGVERLGRASCLGIAAARLSLDDAGLLQEELLRYTVGVIMGTTMGESQILEKINHSWVTEGEDAIDPAMIVRYPCYVLASNIAQELGIEGPNLVIPTACAAGNYAIGYAYDLLQTGQADIMLAGGADAFSRIAFIGFNRLLAVAPDKCQPFDKNRKGMMVGEGAGIVVLETLESALKRNAEIYAEVLGYGLSCDASHMTAPDARGMAKAMAKALYASEVSREDVEYISAHGTGTPANDKAEAQAIKEVFGAHAQSLPTSSIKSMLGHTMGAASAIEAVSCCLSIKYGQIPATINFETPDPDCDIDCVPNASRRAEVTVALNNSSAFGGNNACLVLRKF
ncbi:MAG: beta-ketoacyl-[acyl-carrier-protein] synthase family protein [Candidatus Omnitrophica bacterium]|nr:beta-ketoacyl-[acyl-carrier-protein] synthase family protein [Candidatus Omnitrophota bacterium]